MANNNQKPLVVLPLPPAKYDVQYFNLIIKMLNFNFSILSNPGEARVSNLVITNKPPPSTEVLPNGQDKKAPLVINDIPKSAVGLPKGAVWRDEANGNVLKIVS